MVAQKIHNIMGRVSYLAKDDKVEFGNTKYKALSEEKVTSIMRAELMAEKLVVYPVKMEASRAGQITHVDVTYRIVDIEDGDYIEVVSCGDGADSQDKGAGKAMTYAFKYMFLRTFAIPTGEDPDKISSEELNERMAKIEPATVAAYKEFCKNNNIEEERFCKRYGVDRIEDITKGVMPQVVKDMSKYVK